LWHSWKIVAKKQSLYIRHDAKVKMLVYWINLRQNMSLVELKTQANLEQIHFLIRALFDSGEEIKKGAFTQ
jgi:hypothetical protein